MLDSHLPDYDFPIEMIDLEAVKEKQDGWKADTYKVPSTMARALVRTDTGAVLGIHGSKYKPINHADAVDKIMEGVQLHLLQRMAFQHLPLITRWQTMVQSYVANFCSKT